MCTELELCSSGVHMNHFSNSPIASSILKSRDFKSGFDFKIS